MTETKRPPMTEKAREKPEEKVHPTNRQPFNDLGQPEASNKTPDVDPLVDASSPDAEIPVRWPTALELIEEVERHALRSHGLFADVQLLKDVADRLRELLDVPKEHEDAETPAQN